MNYYILAAVVGYVAVAVLVALAYYVSFQFTDEEPPPVWESWLYSVLFGVTWPLVVSYLAATLIYYYTIGKTQ